MFGMPDDTTGGQAQNQNNNTMQPSLDGAATHDATPSGVPPTGAATPGSDTDAGNFMADEPQQPASPGRTAPTGDESDDLLGIKQQALQQLTPLVSHLEQTPEEEFRTTMMMIQASDNQSLVQKAYDAAQKIADEKTRAQALLDIVNEINYFTQHKENPAEQQ